MRPNERSTDAGVTLGAPEAIAALSTNPEDLRAEFARQLAALEAAARDWGVRPGDPEAAFVSSFIHTQRGFAKIAMHLCEGLNRVADSARDLSAYELDRQRKINDRALVALEEARMAVQNLELEKEKVTTRLVDRIIPNMIDGVRQQLVVYHQKKRWDDDLWRLIGVGGVMIALIMVGFAWSTWDDWQATSKFESLVTATAKCEYTSKWTDDKGNRLCELNDFARE